MTHQAANNWGKGEEEKLKTKILFYAKASLSPQPGPSGLVAFLSSQAVPRGEDGTITLPWALPLHAREEPSPQVQAGETQWEVARKPPTGF